MLFPDSQAAPPYHGAYAYAYSPGQSPVRGANSVERPRKLSEPHLLSLGFLSFIVHCISWEPHCPHLTLLNVLPRTALRFLYTTRFHFLQTTTLLNPRSSHTTFYPAMSTADELKALGNKAIAAKNYDEAVYVLFCLISMNINRLG